MLFYLSHLTHYVSFLNVFRYLTFRSIGALVSSFFIIFFIGKPFIHWMKRVQRGGQPIRTDGPESHLLYKQNTPTMGGGMLLLGFTGSIILWCDWSSPYVWLTTFTFLSLSLLGYWDDMLKIIYRNSVGLNGKKKLIFQMLIGILGALGTFFALRRLCFSTSSTVFTGIYFPFFKNFVVDLGWVYPLWAALVVTGTSNAVNLTDGLDGLAIGPVMVTCVVLAIFSYVSGHSLFSLYLKIPYIPMAGELAVCCAALLGAGLGFLWYNAPPAMIIMGDMGALALGGTLAAIALFIKQELLLGIVGGVFVVETLSVVIQVVYFKHTQRRIFLMAPLHHHFEKRGWSESAIVMRFWIISCLLGIGALTALKIR
ncbi:phospho-N-acetylmuramoyl-pentapeptide-transferase [Holospora curviuscula]|uniref:Phospho-N-acetylmuramoyl-pentapeptide-transferase n=1 Tax=Holospora curviuscula TaxID=1082868 RepID=A0A2S5R7M5_9PROT|nr:Phospho-N-acetylmuramoyl-pentapeptide-transferase [Holospora curviuscula]